MHDQPKFFPQRGTTLFADGRSVRPQVANTVARSQAHPDSYFATGLVDGKEADGMPFAVTPALLERGQERFNIYCTPCHSRVGNGQGMLVQRGYSKASDFHGARLRQAPLGHFFHVITNGYGSMPDYAAQVTPADRWAIVAYIRALQLSQNAQPGDVPAGQHVESLKSLAESQGLPTGFSEQPRLPETSVTGTPEGKLLVLPTPGASPTSNVPAAAKPVVKSPTTGEPAKQ